MDELSQREVQLLDLGQFYINRTEAEKAAIEKISGVRKRLQMKKRNLMQSKNCTG